MTQHIIPAVKVIADAGKNAKPTLVTSEIGPIVVKLDIICSESVELSVAIPRNCGRNPKPTLVTSELGPIMVELDIMGSEAVELSMMLLLAIPRNCAATSGAIAEPKIKQSPCTCAME